jgi:hypothetical protein
MAGGIRGRAEPGVNQENIRADERLAILPVVNAAFEFGEGLRKNLCRE